jgi:hypothetical protein
MTWRNFGDYVWITFLDSRGAMPWKAMLWCTVTGVLMTLFVILKQVQDDKGGGSTVSADAAWVGKDFDLRRGAETRRSLGDVAPVTVILMNGL